MKMSPTTQRNTVSEGMALGLLMNEVGELSGEKYLIDLAFEAEFPLWTHASEFPQVRTDLRNGLDGIYAITRADYRKQVFHLYWDSGEWPRFICVRPQWEDVDIDADVVAASLHPRIPAESWRILAASYLRHFNRET